MELTDRSIERYMMACIHLYGALSLTDVQSTIYYYTKEKVSYEKIEEIATSLINAQTELQRYRHYLYSDTFIAEKDVPYFYTQIQKNKPFYRPEKLEFLRYVAQTYFELTPDMKAFKDYLTKDLKISVYRSENILKQTVYNIQSSVGMQEIMNDLQMLLKKDELEKNKLIQHISKMNSTTRTAYHRGHTSLEINQQKRVLL